MGGSLRDVAVFDVPGAFELPLAARTAALSGRFDAVVALGAVIQGDTDHYEHVAREAASGIAAVARETGVPVAFGVLTVREAAPGRGARAAGARQQGRGGGARGGDARARAARDRGRQRRPSTAARRAGRGARRRAAGGPDGPAHEGARVRLPDPLPVGDQRRADWPRDRACSGRCARARRRCGRWPSGWPSARRVASRSSTRRSPRPRPTGGSTGSRRWTGRSCGSGPTSSPAEAADARRGHPRRGRRAREALRRGRLAGVRERRPRRDPRKVAGAAGPRPPSEGRKQA